MPVVARSGDKAKLRMKDSRNAAIGDGWRG